MTDMMRELARQAADEELRERSKLLEPEAPKPLEDTLREGLRTVDGDERQRLALALRYGAPVGEGDPEREARVLRLQGLTGLPPEMIRPRLDEVEREAELGTLDVDGIRQRSPVLAEMLTESESMVKMAFDDIQTLGSLEWFLRSTVAAYRIGSSQVEYGAGSFLKIPGTNEHLRPIASGVLKAMGFDGAPSEERLRYLEEEVLPAYLGQESFLERGWIAFVKLLPQMVGASMSALAGAGVATAIGKQPAVTVPGGAVFGAVAWSYIQETGFAHRELSQFEEDGRKLDPDLVIALATMTGVGNAALETFSLGRAARVFPWGREILERIGTDGVKRALKRRSFRNAVKGFAKDYATAATTEPLTEMAQELTPIIALEIAKMVEGGEWDPTDWEGNWHRVFDIGLEVLEAMIVGGGFLSGPTLGANMVESHRAARTVAVLRTAGKLAEQSKLRERDGPMFEQYVARAVRNRSAPTNVFILRKEWDRIWTERGQDPAKVAEAVFGDAKPYQDAVAAGDAVDLVIPYEKFINHLAPTESMDALQEHVRLYQSDPSIAQVVEHSKETEGWIRSVPATPEEFENPETRQVYEEEYRAILTVRPDPEEAHTGAMIRAHLTDRQAARSGRSPLQLYREFVVRYYGPDGRQRASTATQRGDAVHLYLTPGKRELTEDEEAVRSIAAGLLRGEWWAIEMAAEQMAGMLEPGTPLVPMPDHTGSTATNLALVTEIANRLEGATVADVLVSDPRESQDDRRAGGRRGLLPDQIKTRIKWALGGKPQSGMDGTRPAEGAPINPKEDMRGLARWFARNGGISIDEEGTWQESYRGVLAPKEDGRSFDGWGEILHETWPEIFHDQAAAFEWLRDEWAGGDRSGGRLSLDEQMLKEFNENVEVLAIHVQEVLESAGVVASKAKMQRIVAALTNDQGWQQIGAADVKRNELYLVRDTGQVHRATKQGARWFLENGIDLPLSETTVYEVLPLGKAKQGSKAKPDAPKVSTPPEDLHNAVLIDVVRTTGATLASAERALPGARYLVWAQAAEVLEQGRLSALHNLTAENLAFADQMGGFAVPSIAIVPEEVGLDQFGEVTLIGTADLVDPTQNEVWDADAYSSTFPQPDYAPVKYDTIRKVTERVEAFAHMDDKSGSSHQAHEYASSGKPGEIIPGWLRAMDVQALYLSEVHGETIEPVMQPASLQFTWVTQPSFKRFLAEHGYKPDFFRDPEYHRALSDAALNARIEELEAQIAGHEGKPVAESFEFRIAHYRKMLETRKAPRGGRGYGDFNADGLFGFGQERGLRESIRKEHELEVDRDATRARLEQALAGREADFQRWVNDTVLGMFGEPRVIVGRKKLPYTLENIVAAMTRGGVKAKESTLVHGDGKVRAEAAKRFRSLKALRAAAGRIKARTDVDAARKEAGDLLQSYREAAVEHYRYATGSFGGTWEGLDGAMRALSRWARTKGRGIEELRRAMQAEDFVNVPAEVLELGVKAGQAMLEAPVPYFEAKPRRGVQLSEFAGAVVPDDVQESTINILNKHGIPWRKYGERFDKEARQRTVVELRNSLQETGRVNVLFQRDLVKLFQDGYHGSPHRFERFDLSFMGTGEGAQAFGWGHYAGSLREVGERYAETNLDPDADLLFEGKGTQQVTDELFRHKWGPERALAEAINWVAHQYKVNTHPRDSFESRLHAVLALAIKTWRDDIAYRKNVLLPKDELGVARRQKIINERIDESKATGDPDAPLTATQSAGLRELTLGREAYERNVDSHHEAIRYMGAVLAHLQDPGFLKRFEKPQRGQLYKVRVPENDALLIWDPLMTEQPSGVLERLEAAGLLPAGAVEMLDLVEAQRAIARNPATVFEADDGALLKRWDELDAARKALPLATAFKGWLVGPDTTGQVFYRTLADAAVLFQRAVGPSGLFRDQSLKLIANPESQADSPQRHFRNHLARVLFERYQNRAAEFRGMRDDQMASIVLREAGIPGHRFRDGFTRGKKGEGSYNFVIYDDAHIDIVETFYQDAWHGSPTKYRKGDRPFLVDYIGTGENTMGQGWGLYFTSERQAAEWYRENLRDYADEVDDLVFRYHEALKGLGSDEVVGWEYDEVVRYVVGKVDKLMQDAGVKDYAEGVPRFFDEAVAAVRTDYLEGAKLSEEHANLYKSRGPLYLEQVMAGVVHNREQAENVLRVRKDVLAEAIRELDVGQVFKVALPDDVEMLDWRMGLENQSEQVKEALTKLWRENFNVAPGESLPHTSGETFYWSLVDRLNRGISYDGRDLVSFGETQYQVLRELIQLPRSSWAARLNERIANKRETMEVLEQGVAEGVISAFHVGLKKVREDVALLEEIDLDKLSMGIDGRREASLALKAAGIPGHIYESNAGNKNFVIYDDTRVEVVETFYQKRRRGPNASITFVKGGKEFDITLFEGSNPSSLFHETAHFYLEMLGHLATEPGAVDDLKRDHDIALKWLGVTRHNQLKTEHHEKWARAFEQYLRNGKAPSAALTDTFAKIRAYMMQVYGRIRELVKLSPEIEGVFDRMLASEQEIQAAHAAQSLGAMEGLEHLATDAEWLNYLDTDSRQVVASEDELRRLLLEHEARVGEDWYQTELERVREEVREELGKQPAYRAGEFLQYGRLPGTRGIPRGLQGEKGGPLKLSYTVLLDEYGAGVIRELPTAPYVYRRDDRDPSHETATPDELAPHLGFSSGAALVNALRGLEPLSRAVEERAAELMDRKYGNLLRERERLREAATDAALNRESLDKALIELRILARGTERPDKAGERVKRLDLDRLRKDARETMQGRKYGDLQPHVYQRAAAKHARQAFEAAKAGKLQEAFDEKDRQIWNTLLYRAARDVKNDAEILAREAHRANSPRRRAIRGKAGADYQERGDALLELYEFRPASGPEVRRRESLREWVERERAEHRDALIDPRILDRADRIHWREITIGELRAVVDAIRNIDHLAELKSTLLIGQERRALADWKAEALASLEREFPNKIDLTTDVGPLRSVGGKFWASNLRMEELIRRMDGDDPNGPWARALMQVLQRAEVDEGDRSVEITLKLAEAFSKLPKDRMNELLSKEVYIESLGRSLLLHQMIAVALNTGSEQNAQRLFDGMSISRKYPGWSPDVTLEILNKLTREDWDYVQSIWDTLETLWPRIAAMEKRLTGLIPEKVPAKSFTRTFDGVEVSYRGGYYPLVYDPDESQAGHRQADAGKDAATLFGHGHVRALTVHGHVIKRVENFAAPLMLDLQVVVRHTQKVIHDFTHREALISIWKILHDDDIRFALRERLGRAQADQLTAWVTHVANPVDVSDLGLGGVETMMRKARMNMTIAVMGFKATISVQNVVNLVNLHEKISPRFVAEAYLKAANWNELLEEVNRKSGMMRHRFNNLERDIRTNVIRLMGKRGILPQVQQMAFYFVQETDKWTGYPGWLAAYNEAIAEGLPEADAIAKANHIIRGVLGAGAPKDIAAIQRGSEFMKWATMFFSWFNMTHQRYRAMAHDARRAKQQGYVIRALPKLLARLMVVGFLVPILSELIVRRGPEDDEDPVRWAILRVLLHPLMTVPFLRDGASLLEGKIEGKRRSVKYGPIARGAEDLMAAVDALPDLADDPEKAIKQLNRAAGLAIGYPSAQAEITGGQLWNYLQGDADPEGVFQFAGDLLFRDGREAEHDKRRAR